MLITFQKDDENDREGGGKEHYEDWSSELLGDDTIPPHLMEPSLGYSTDSDSEESESNKDAEEEDERHFAGADFKAKPKGCRFKKRVLLVPCKHIFHKLRPNHHMRIIQKTLRFEHHIHYINYDLDPRKEKTNIAEYWMLVSLIAKKRIAVFGEQRDFILGLLAAVNRVAQMGK